MQLKRLIGLVAALAWSGAVHFPGFAAPARPGPPAAVPAPAAPGPARPTPTPVVAPPASPAPVTPPPTTLPASTLGLHWPGDADHITIPLTRAGDLLLAPVRINGHDMGPFLIDTAFATTTVDRDAIKLMGLETIAAAPQRIAEQPSGDYVQVSELSVGPAAASTPGAPMYASPASTVVLAADLRPVLAQYNLKISGIIGNDLLKTQPFTLDSRAATLTFYDPARFSSAFAPAALSGGASTVPADVEGSFAGKLHVHSSGGFPTVPGKVRGHEGWFMIQTAAPGGLTLYGPFLSLNRDISEGYHPIPGGGPMVGGDPLVQANDSGPFDGVEVLGRPESRVFAAFTLPGRPAGVGFEVTCAGSIGAALLRDTRLTLDYAGGRYWVTPLQKETTDQMLARLGDPAARDLTGESALMRAVAAGRADAVKALLDRKADPNVPTASDITPLMIAARDGQDAIAAMLLAHGANPDLRAAVGATTALLDACCDGRAGIVGQLLAAKADAKLADLQGSTPLHRAAEAGSLPCVQALLKAGADVNARTKEKVSVLMAAAISGDNAVIAALLKAGADPNSVGPNGWTPLILAAAAGSSVETLSGLLDGGANPNFPDDGGRTALMMVAQRGDERAVRLLVLRGADPNAKSVTGRTVRDFAAEAPQTDALRALVAPRQ
jgi:ankyrin repeat protein